MVEKLTTELSKKFKALFYFSKILQFLLSILVCVFSYLLMGIHDKHAAAPYFALIYNEDLIRSILAFTTIAPCLYLFYCSYFIVLDVQEIRCNFFIALIVIPIETLCETLFFSHTVCLRDNDQVYIIVRSVFVITIISINIGIYNFLYFKHTSICTSKSLVTSISLINVLSMAMIVMNVILLVNIKNYSSLKQFNSKEIKLGFFNSTEITQIESGVYVKDEFYKYRAIATLEQVLDSDNKKLAYTVDYSELDTEYYYIVFLADLYCNFNSSKFYKDCQNNIQLKIIVRYINDGSIPKYNCASVQNNQSVLDCPNLTNSYSLVLIQEEQDTVSPAWKSIANCNQIPTFYIDRNPILDPSHPFSKSNQISTDKLFYFNFLICFILFLKIYVS